MNFDRDNFLLHELTNIEWQKFKNDPSIKFHPSTLNESYDKKKIKIFAPVCGKRPYVVENLTKKELVSYFKKEI